MSHSLTQHSYLVANLLSTYIIPALLISPLSSAFSFLSHQVNFIMQEAHEKVNEIRIKVRLVVIERCAYPLTDTISFAHTCHFYRLITTLTWRSSN